MIYLLLCLSCHAQVAITELTLLRTLERIENLKTKNQWSFRQPKKQRGVGGLVKNHWDYLIDEVVSLPLFHTKVLVIQAFARQKWMRADFREERKWKLALAHELAREVVRWHAAGTCSERLSQGITISWKRKSVTAESQSSAPQPEDLDAMELDYSATEEPKTSLLSIDYGSEDDDDDEGDEKDTEARRLDDLQEAEELTGEAVYATQQSEEDAEDSNPFSELKREEIEESMPKEETEVHLAAAQTAIKAEETSSSSLFSGALVNTSQDPIVGFPPLPSQSSNNNVDEHATVHKPKKAPVREQLRDHIAYSEDLQFFLTPEDMRLDLDGPDTGCHTEPPELAIIFPDLQLFDFIDPASAQPTVETRRKGGSRADKDDPHKRAEDTAYSKLTPVTKYMHTKPTLIGPLQPARRWKGGSWVNMEDSLPIVDADINQKSCSDARSGTFSCRCHCLWPHIDAIVIFSVVQICSTHPKIDRLGRAHRR